MNMVERVVSRRVSLSLNWSSGRLARIGLFWADAKDGQETPAAELSAHGKAVAGTLARYAAGKKVVWPDLPFDFDQLTPFEAKVLKTLFREVGHGESVTYGKLAAMAGNPKAARAVGGVMARNPWPLIIPCHRVLGADGSMTGFTNPGGIELKKYLLELEKSMERYPRT